MIDRTDNVNNESSSNELKNESHNESENDLKQTLFVLFILGIIALIGVVFIFIGETKSEQLYIEWWREILSKVSVEFGIALIIAAVVSGLFDRLFHWNMFGRPIKKIENNLNVVVQRVEDETLTLTKSVSDNVKEMSKAINLVNEANVFGIQSINQRLYFGQTWRANVKRIIDDADEFVYFTGRTLDELFFDEINRDTDILEALKEKLKNEKFQKISFIIEDVYSEGSSFNIEVKAREPIVQNSLSFSGKLTAEKILTLKYSNQLDTSQKSKLGFRLSFGRIPQMMLITDKTLMFQPYLPFKSGFEGIIVESEKNNGHRDNFLLHNTYKSSFHELFKFSEEPEKILLSYYKRYSINSTEQTRLKELLEVMETQNQQLPV